MPPAWTPARKAYAQGGRGHGCLGPLLVVALLVLACTCSLAAGALHEQLGGRAARRPTTCEYRCLPDTHEQDDIIATHAGSFEDVLGVAVLLTEPTTHNIKDMRRSLKLVGANIATTTPLRVYIFTKPLVLEQLVDQMQDPAEFGLRPDQLHVLPLTGGTWELPDVPNAAQELWHHTRSASYIMMGDWRLKHMPHIMKALGHRYVLQMDDDSFVEGPIGENIVQSFRAAGTVFGARSTARDQPFTCWGLPDLARFFLLQEKMLPTGPLLSHCKPPTLEGLHTYVPVNTSAPSIGGAIQLGQRGMTGTGDTGFDNLVYNGNFIILDLEWWFQPLVQRFVHLVRASGGTARYRWNEQSVQSMLRHMLVPDSQFRLFDFAYDHAGHT